MHINLEDIQISYFNRTIGGWTQKETTVERKTLKEYIDEVMGYTAVECSDGIESLCNEERYREDGIYDQSLLDDFNRRSNNKYKSKLEYNKKFIFSYHNDYTSASQQKDLLKRTIKEMVPSVWSSLFKDNYYNGADTVYDKGCKCIVLDFDNTIIYKVIRDHFDDLCTRIPNIIWMKRSFNSKCHLFIYVDKIYVPDWMKQNYDTDDNYVYLSECTGRFKDLYKYIYKLFIHYIAEYIYEYYGEDFFIDEKQVKLTDNDKDTHNATASQQLGGAYCPDICINGNIQEICTKSVYEYVEDKLGPDVKKISTLNLKQKNYYIRCIGQGNAPKQVSGGLIHIDRDTKIDGIELTGNDLRYRIVHLLIKKYGADYARDVIINNFDSYTAEKMMATLNSNKDKPVESFVMHVGIWKWIEIFKPVIKDKVEWNLADDEYLSSKIDDITNMLYTKNVYLHSPCGSGKSTLARELCGISEDESKDDLFGLNQSGKKVIVACHLNSIMDSVYYRLKNFKLRGEKLNNCMQSGEIPDIALVSYNGLIRLLSDPLLYNKITSDYTIIVDEVHSLISTMHYRGNIMINLMYRLPERGCIFLTGTPCTEEYLLPNIIYVDVKKEPVQKINYHYVHNVVDNDRNADITYTIINKAVDIINIMGDNSKLVIFENVKHDVITDTLKKLYGDSNILKISRMEKEENDKYIDEWTCNMQKCGIQSDIIADKLNMNKTELTKFYEYNKTEREVIVTTSYSDEGIEIKDELDTAYIIMRSSDTFKQLTMQRAFRFRKAKNIEVYIVEEKKSSSSNTALINNTLSTIFRMVEEGVMSTREYAALCDNIALMCDTAQIGNNEMKTAALMAGSHYNLIMNYSIDRYNCKTMFPGCMIEPYKYAVFGEIVRNSVDKGYRESSTVNNAVKDILNNYHALINSAVVDDGSDEYNTLKLIGFKTVYDSVTGTYKLSRYIVKDDARIKLWIESMCQIESANAADVKEIKNVLHMIDILWTSCRMVRYAVEKNSNNIYTLIVIPLNNNIEWDVYDDYTMKETVKNLPVDYKSECMMLAECIVNMFTYEGVIKWKSLRRYLKIRESFVLNSLTSGQYYRDLEVKEDKVNNIYDRCNMDIDDDFTKSLYQMKDSFFKWNSRNISFDSFGRAKVLKYQLNDGDNCFYTLEDAYDFLTKNGGLTCKFKYFKDKVWKKYVHKI